jgi:hypothetical protein
MIAYCCLEIPTFFFSELVFPLVTSISSYTKNILLAHKPLFLFGSGFILFLLLLFSAKPAGRTSYQNSFLSARAEKQKKVGNLKRYPL